MTTMLEHALAYADRGWRVFPLVSGGKVPLLPACPTNAALRREGKPTRCRGECGQDGHGCHDGTTDPDRIRRWWSEHPDAGIGLACGSGSGVWVLDVDADKGGLVSAETLDRLHPDRPPTMTSRTGGGGLHLFWLMPDDSELRALVRNGAGRLKLPDGTPLPGLDTRSDGGYVVLPPSGHPSGRRYEWADPRGAADAPEWLLDIVTANARKTGQPAEVVRLPMPRSTPGHADHPYAVKALDNACRRVAGMSPNTGRNDALTREAFTIGGYVGSGALAESTARLQLVAAGLACGLEAHKVPDCVARALAAGKERPTAVPETTAPPERVRRLPEPPPAPWADDPGPHVEDPGFGVEVEAEMPEDSGPLGDRDDWADSIGAHLTDMGNAKRLAAAFGGNLRFCPAMGGSKEHAGWLRWTGALWAPDESGQVMRYARCVSSMLDEEADDLEREAADETVAEDERLKKAKAAEAVRKWARRSESMPALRSMVGLLQSESGIYAKKSWFDADPYLLNTPNGVVDLRTGRIMPPERRQMMTRSTTVPYEPDAPCPRWEEFIRTVMCGQEEMVEFLQRAVGYSIVGGTPEQVFMVCYGTGSNGKGTFTGTLGSILGTYACAIAHDTFVGRKEGGIPNDIARLDGIRWASASEVKENAQLDEALVKSCTGNGMETITARFLNAEFFDFIPAFTAWYSCNHKPVIRGTDPGIWRRIRLIPWLHSFETGGKITGYSRKLVDEEGPGILAWAVRGAVAWCRDGLTTPAGVVEATKAYRSEMDLIADFLGECCQVSPAAVGVANSDLFRAFQSWSRDNGERDRSHRWFTRQLQERGFRQGRGECRRWDGIALLQVPVDERSEGRWKHEGRW